jgi:hypothetical protein
MVVNPQALQTLPIVGCRVLTNETPEFVGTLLEKKTRTAVTKLCALRGDLGLSAFQAIRKIR